MSVELIKKQVDINESIKRESVQVVKERDIIVPDGKPDMQKVLYVDGKIIIDQIDVQDDRVMYKGQINLTILYVPENNVDSICVMKGSIPLEDFIIIEGVNKDQKVNFEYEIEHIYWNILNERKLNTKVIIEAIAEVTKAKEVDVVTDIHAVEPVQIKTTQVDIIKPSQMKEEKLIVKDELTIMQGKSSIDEVLQLDAQIKEEQIKRTDNELLFNGIIEVNTLYKGQGGENKLEVVTHRIPFSGSSDVPKGEMETDWNCDLEVTPTYIQVSPDYDGEDRMIEVETIVTAKYNTFDKVTENVITDIYCPGQKVAMTAAEQNYMTLAARAHAAMPRKEVVEVEGMTPDNSDIFKVTIEPSIDEQVVKDNKLSLKGLNEVCIVFVRKDDAGRIETVNKMIPFTQEVDITGADKNAMIRPNVEIKDINVISQNKNDVAIEYVTDTVVEAYNQDVLPVLQEVELANMSKEEIGAYPSIAVYIVKKGDTLWNIAKKFNTTVKDIVDINSIEENAVIHPGQKLIVIKRNKN